MNEGDDFICISDKINQILEQILAPEIKVVAFDMFNTLVQRPVNNPREIFKIIENISGIEFFSSKRFISELEARKNIAKNVQDLSIDFIYEKYAELFFVELDETEKIKQIELDVEYNLIYPRKIGKYLFDAVVSAGKNICIVSDMYLPKIFLEKVLAHCGYFGYTQLYVSCEYAMSKRTGLLWKHVVYEYATSRIYNKEIMCIGDDYNSDVKIPETLGLKTAFLPSSVSIAKKKKGFQSIISSINFPFDFIFKGLMINSVFSDPYLDFLSNSSINENPIILGELVAPYFINTAMQLLKYNKVITSENESFLIRKAAEVLAANGYGSIPEYVYVNIPNNASYTNRLNTPNGLFDTLQEIKLPRLLTLREFLRDFLHLEDDDVYKAVLQICFYHGYTSENAQISEIEKEVQLLNTLQPIWKKSCIEESDGFKHKLNEIVTRKGCDAILDVYALKGIKQSFENIDIIKLTGERTSVISNVLILSTTQQNQFLYGIDNEFVQLITDQPNVIDKSLKKNTDESDTDIRTILQKSILDFVELFAKLTANYMQLFNSVPNELIPIFHKLANNLNLSDIELIRRLAADNFCKAIIESVKGKSKRKSNSNSIFENIRIFGYKFTEKLGVLSQARALYHFLRGDSKIKINIFNRVDDAVTIAISELEACVKNTTMSTGAPLFITQAFSKEKVNYFFRHEETNNLLLIPLLNLTKKYVNTVNLPAELVQLYTISLTGTQSRQANRIFKSFYAEHENLRNAVTALNQGYVVGKNRNNELLVYELYRYFNALFDILKPRFLLFWNHFVPVCLPAVISAEEHGIPLVYAENAPIPKTLLLDTTCNFGGSLVARYYDKFMELPLSDEDIAQTEDVLSRLRDDKTNRYIQVGNPEFLILKERIDKTKPILMLAGNYDIESGFPKWWDKGREYVSPMFASTEDALKELALLSEENGWNLIFKPHPLMIKHEPKFDIPKNVYFLDSGDIYELFDFCDVVITIASTTSYAALISGKPNVVVGYQLLKGQGCAYEAYKREDIAPMIKKAIEHGFTNEMHTAFVKHTARLLKYYLFDNGTAGYGQASKDLNKLFKMVAEGKKSYDYLF